jgi:nucleotide-binding universal stress UspA family protein
MFKHIPIATNGSDLAKRAASRGFELAKLLEANVTVSLVRVLTCR